MCGRSYVKKTATKPQPAPSPISKTPQVIAKLRKRATDAIVGKKGADVAQAFNDLADVAEAYENGRVYDTVDKFIENFKV